MDDKAKQIVDGLLDGKYDGYETENCLLANRIEFEMLDQRLVYSKKLHYDDKKNPIFSFEV